MADLQQGDSIQLDFTTNGSTPDGVAEESHTVDTFDEAITWSTWTGFAGGSTVKWQERYGRVINGTQQWSNWSNLLSDTLAAAAFNPNSLFGGTDFGYVFDTTDSTKLFTASGCTGTPSFTGAIGCLQDQSGKGNNFTQSTGANQPTWQNVSGGMVKFDASNDELKGASGLYGKGSMTIVMAIQDTLADSNSAKQYWSEDSSGGGNPIYSAGTRFSGSSGFVLNYQRDNSSTVNAQSIAVAVADGATHVIVIEDTGSQVKVSKDCGAFTTVSYTRGTLTVNQGRLGAGGFGTFGGYIGRSIFIGRILTGATVATAGSELNSAYNWVAAAHGVSTC
jgi:hypothetical protein